MSAIDCYYWHKCLPNHLTIRPEIEMKKENNRIKFAFNLEGWNYDGGDRVELEKSKKVTPAEYYEEMSGSIFCPVCFTNLSRSPSDKPNFSNGRFACFVHRPSFSHIECDLRTPRPEGMLYPTEELAKQAIAHEKLAIINAFRDEPERADGEQAKPYDQSAVEELDGPISGIAISRHRGEKFHLPSKISTVAGICRKFDQNLNKYYVFPGTEVAKLLSEVLINVKDVTDEDDVPKLYFGEIMTSHNAGINPKPTNLRMTSLVSNDGVKDFYLKARAGQQEEKGVSDNSGGRIVLFWGKITGNGIGLCVERLKWGEYSLLAPKYNKFLEQG